MTTIRPGSTLLRFLTVLLVGCALGSFDVKDLSAQMMGTSAELVRDLEWRNIGPANMTGRIAAIDALNTDYRTVLIGSASGGVFKSTNGGITWDAIFDDYGSGSIGDVAFFQPDPDIIWVGTGEAANRNSSGWGDGIYKSVDGGETFEWMGLAETHYIAEIAVHPTDPDVVWAASPGHLWGYSGDRGLFKTEDGGETWEKVGNGLPDDGLVGATEVILDPENPDILYVGMYHRLRQPWWFTSGGGEGGIFKSEDGGASFRKLTVGLPEGETGMIDISIHRADPRIIAANVEASDDLPDDLSVPGPGVYISRDRGESWTYLLRHNTRPFYHGQIEIDPLDPDRIYAVSREFRVSRDGGETWSGKWWGGGGDDHDMWIAPYDSNIFYNATDQGAYLSVDGGESILHLNNMAIGQYYAIGVDMRDPYWVMGGLQDNALWLTPSNSREGRGILNMHSTWLGEGDGFHSQIDPTDWTTAYLVNHVGFAARLDVVTRDHTFITPTPETIINFDEYFDPDFPDTPIEYTIDPGEHWFFRDRPERPLLPPQFRFNWSSPLVLSPNNPRRVYFAGNHLFRSEDRGDSWRIVSPDLTSNDPERRNPTESGGLTWSQTGGENHFTIVTIAESPLDPELVWVGTDDGHVHVTRDGGEAWTEVTQNIPGFPEAGWVSRVEASRHAQGTIYVTVDNHRLDDMRPYVWRSTDFGESWDDLSGGLVDLDMSRTSGDVPHAVGSLYVVREDPVNPNLLFVGSEFGVYASVDAGASWTEVGAGLPTVAVHDLVIHPRDADLIAGTHGRSLWILDDITPLRQTTPELRAEAGALFAPRQATDWVRINLGRKQPDFYFRGANPPAGAMVHYFLGDASSEVGLVVEDPFSDARAELEAPAREGINRVRWNLVFPSTDAQRATYADRLDRAIETLAGRVPESRQEELRTIRSELIAARDDRSLNAVRSRLVTAFGAFAGGEMLFGPRLVPNRATPGSYRVVLTVNGVEYTTELEVRADPLRSSDGTSELPSWLPSGIGR